MTKQLFKKKKIPESLYKRRSSHGAGCAKPRSLYPSSIGEECGFNLLVPSVFADQVSITSFRDAAWKETSVIPNSNNWVIFGVGVGRGIFLSVCSVLVFPVVCGDLHVFSAHSPAQVCRIYALGNVGWHGVKTPTSNSFPFLNVSQH